MALSVLIGGLSLSSWTPPRSLIGQSALRRPHVTLDGPRMMFGGGGDDKEPGFMDKLKQAQQMFNPEMMKKYADVGQKVQALQEELAQTEIECANKDGAVVVKVSGTQVPISVEVNDALCGSGSETASAELTSALQQAHAKSGSYAQQKMADVYKDLGLGMPPPAQQ